MIKYLFHDGNIRHKLVYKDDGVSARLQVKDKWFLFNIWVNVGFETTYKLTPKEEKSFPRMNPRSYNYTNGATVEIWQDGTLDLNRELRKSKDDYVKRVDNYNKMKRKIESQLAKL